MVGYPGPWYNRTWVDPDAGGLHVLCKERVVEAVLGSTEAWDPDHRLAAVRALQHVARPALICMRSLV